MKIVHLVFSFCPGGAEMLVKEIVLNTDKNYNTEIWALGHTTDKEFEQKFVNELCENKIPYIHIGKALHKNRVKVIFKIRKLIKERKPDIINTHSEIVTFFTIPASLGLNVRIVETIHNTIISFPLIHRYIAKFFVKKYVAISDKCRQLIKKVINVKDNKIELIYNGIKVNKYQQRERTINEKVKSVINVGRLDVQKDQLTLLKAFSILKEQIDKTNIHMPQLNIIGIGHLEMELKKYCMSNGIKEHVKFWGARNDVPDLLFENDIWIMTSKWEGLSIALLEAMASGLPVIATDVGSNSEVITNCDNGILIEKENPAILAEELLKLIINKPERKRLSENAQKKAKDYSIGNCVNKYLRMYNSLK